MKGEEKGRCSLNTLVCNPDMERCPMCEGLEYWPLHTREEAKKQKGWKRRHVKELPKSDRDNLHSNQNRDCKFFRGDRVWAGPRGNSWCQVIHNLCPYTFRDCYRCIITMHDAMDELIPNLTLVIPHGRCGQPLSIEGGSVWIDRSVGPIEIEAIDEP